MDTTAVSARLRHLNSCAHALASTSPAVSVHIMSQFNKVVFDQEVEISEAQRRKACGGCGTLSVPGWTSSISVGRELPPHKKRKTNRKVERRTAAAISTEEFPLERAVSGTSVVSTCWLCGRKLQQALHPQTATKPTVRGSAPDPSTSAQPKPQSQPTPQTEASLSGVKKPTAANSNSRKRAKSRKQQTLQSILSNQQPAKPNNSSARSGLNLMDFLQTQ